MNTPERNGKTVGGRKRDPDRVHFTVVISNVGDARSRQMATERQIPRTALVREIITRRLEAAVEMDAAVRASTVRFSVTLPRFLDEQLRSIARRYGRSRASLVGQWIDEETSVDDKPAPRPHRR